MRRGNDNEVEKQKRGLPKEAQQPLKKDQPATIRRIPKEEGIPIGRRFMPYKRSSISFADLVHRDDADPFRHVTYDTVQWAIDTIIKEEGPIHDILLQQSLLEAGGGVPLSNDFLTNIDIAKLNPKLFHREGDYWYHLTHQESAKITVRKRSKAHQGSS